MKSDENVRILKEEDAVSNTRTIYFEEFINMKN